jgi:hypothetical protein
LCSDINVHWVGKIVVGLKGVLTNARLLTKRRVLGPEYVNAGCGSLEAGAIRVEDATTTAVGDASIKANNCFDCFNCLSGNIIFVLVPASYVKKPSLHLTILPATYNDLK